MHCGIGFGGGEVSHHLSPCSRSPAAVGVDGSSVTRMIMSVQLELAAYCRTTGRLRGLISLRGLLRCRATGPVGLGSSRAPFCGYFWST